MYPNQPTPFPPQAPQPPQPSQAPQPTPPPDYLNQIAPQAPKQPFFKLTIKSVLVLGAILVAFVIALSVILTSVVNSQREPFQRLSVRLESVQTIADSAQEHLKSSRLRSTNSNLRIFLTNTNRDISEPLLKAGVNVEKIPESIKSEESSDNLLAKLEDARLNAVYDRTYVREMTYILSNMLTLMKQVRASTSNADLQAFLDNTIPSLATLQESFANYEAGT